MRKRRINPRLAMIAAIAFCLAAFIYIWKLVDEGPSAPRVISAFGFAIAGLVWILITVRSRSSAAGGNDG